MLTAYFCRGETCQGWWGESAYTQYVRYGTVSETHRLVDGQSREWGTRPLGARVWSEGDRHGSRWRGWRGWAGMCSGVYCVVWEFATSKKWGESVSQWRASAVVVSSR